MAPTALETRYIRESIRLRAIIQGIVWTKIDNKGSWFKIHNLLSEYDQRVGYATDHVIKKWLRRANAITTTRADLLNSELFDGR